MRPVVEECRLRKKNLEHLNLRSISKFSALLVVWVSGLQVLPDSGQVDRTGGQDDGKARFKSLVRHTRSFEDVTLQPTPDFIQRKFLI